MKLDRVVRHLVLTGRRSDVVAVERVARADRDITPIGAGVATTGHELTGSQVVLVGERKAVRRIERKMRRAAASRWVVVEPFRNPDEAIRAQRIAAHLLGERGASA